MTQFFMKGELHFHLMEVKQLLLYYYYNAETNVQ